MQHLISAMDAAILGAVEGLTEFLPVSSTGHLILTDYWLGIDSGNAGVDAFDVVIQSGALLAVAGFYREQVKAMALGLMGRNPAGLRLAMQLLVGFLPAVVVGLLAAKKIKEHLFFPGPVVAALAVGGVAMIAVELWRGRRAGDHGRDLASMTWKAALIIGCAQCLAMWPGTSRSMITMVAAMVLGFSARSSAEFSFLLALPTLGAATVHDLAKHGHDILQVSGGSGLLIGFVVSAVVAWIAVKGFLAWLQGHGLIPFGIYRILLAILFFAIAPKW